MLTKPKILISRAANSDGKRYADAILSAGGEPFLAYAYQGKEHFDALLLAGGGDLDPAYYGEETCGSHPPDALRDQAEMALCDRYVKEKKPILAICRGCQLLNVYFGGSLIQHLPTAPNHDGGVSTLHTVVNQRGSLAHTLFGKECAVTTSHHQAVKTLGKGLILTQYAKADGVIEGFSHITLPIIATQWHPEKTPSTRPLFEVFIALCHK